jgi:hypothetical protein
MSITSNVTLRLSNRIAASSIDQVVSEHKPSHALEQFAGE